MLLPIRVADAPIQARLIIPGSKSMTNRALLLAALADGVSEISEMLISDDTLTFVNALHHLGIMIQLDKSTRSCIIGGASGRFPRDQATIWCGDAGTVARFLLAACAGSPGSYRLDASEQLCKRPIASLLRALATQGVKISPETAMQMPFTVIGTDGFDGGEIEVDASETGQFVSALLMVAPFAKKPLLIKTEDQVGMSYIEMTCEMMADFGVLVRRMHSGRFSVPTPQRYYGRDYVIEPDFSMASYFFAAAAVTQGKVTIQRVNPTTSRQGDAEFLVVLEKMGCRVIEDETGLSVQGPAELRGVSVDMRHYSDTFMALAAIAPFAKTPTSITNIGHVRKKESDRITVMRTELEKLQVKVEEGKDWLKIYPSQPQPATIESHNDHRIAMAFAIVGLRVPGININNAECVNKICPDFFEMWDKLYP